MRKIKHIIVHCSATETGTVESIRKYHIEHNKWRDIGYHYVIEMDGAIKVGRDEYTAGAHCQGANSESLGICLIGNMAFSEAQLQSLGKLLKDCLTRHNLTPEAVSGHRDWPSAQAQGKTCPNIKTETLRSLAAGLKHARIYRSS